MTDVSAAAVVEAAAEGLLLRFFFDEDLCFFDECWVDDGRIEAVAAANASAAEGSACVAEGGARATAAAAAAAAFGAILPRPLSFLRPLPPRRFFARAALRDWRRSAPVCLRARGGR